MLITIYTVCALYTLVCPDEKWKDIYFCWYIIASYNFMYNFLGAQLLVTVCLKYVHSMSKLEHLYIYSIAYLTLFYYLLAKVIPWFLAANWECGNHLQLHAWYLVRWTCETASLQNKVLLEVYILSSELVYHEMQSTKPVQDRIISCIFPFSGNEVRTLWAQPFCEVVFLKSVRSSAGGKKLHQDH